MNPGRAQLTFDRRYAVILLTSVVSVSASAGSWALFPKRAADSSCAAAAVAAAARRFARSESVAKAERLVYLKLMEKTQNTDPFKFILYSAKIGEQVPPMGDHAEEPLLPPAR